VEPFAVAAVAKAAGTQHLSICCKGEGTIFSGKIKTLLSIDINQPILTQKKFHIKNRRKFHELVHKKEEKKVKKIEAIPTTTS
jgi:hypothetical protein